MTTHERSKGVPVWEAPIVCAKLVICAAFERALSSPEFPTGAPPKAHVPPLLTIQAQSVLEALKETAWFNEGLRTHFAIR